MKRLETPQVLTDVYRDLRDRRLLIPAVALLVAILAVPFLLANGEEPVAPVAAATMPEGAAEVEAAVLAEESGIRNYRKRLSALKEQNPFEQKIAKPDGEAPSADDEDASGDTGAGSTGATVPAGTTGSGASDAVGSGLPTPSTPSDSAPPTAEPAPDRDTADPVKSDPPKPQIRFVVGRIDVSFGELGDAKDLNDVRELDFIPGDKNPIAAFIGLAGNGDRAVFGLTPSVVKTRGDGSCAPTKADGCRFLRLGEGDVRYLKTSSGKTYKLKLRATRFVDVPRDK